MPETSSSPRIDALQRDYALFEQIAAGGYKGWEIGLKHPNFKLPDCAVLGEILRDEAHRLELVVDHRFEGRQFVFDLNQGEIRIEADLTKLSAFLELAARVKPPGAPGELSAVLDSATRRSTLNERIVYFSPRYSDIEGIAPTDRITLREFLREAGYQVDTLKS